MYDSSDCRSRCGCCLYSMVQAVSIFESHHYLLGDRPKQYEPSPYEIVTPAEIAGIRALRLAGNSYAVIAQKYPYSAKTLSSVVNGRDRFAYPKDSKDIPITGTKLTRADVACIQEQRSRKIPYKTIHLKYPYVTIATLCRAAKGFGIYGTTEELK